MSVSISCCIWLYSLLTKCHGSTGSGCICTFRLIVGYVFDPDGSMHPINSCDLELDSVGEDGNDPVSYKLNFTTGLLC